MNAEITQYMKELEAVIQDPSILTAEQIDSEINVVYKVIGMTSTADTSHMIPNEKKELEDIALKVKDILKTLSDTKKAINLTTREKATPKKKQSPFKPTDVSEAKAENVVDTKEVTKEELLNEQKVIPEPVVEKEIPAPVKEEVTITPEEERREDANSVGKEYPMPAPAPEEKIPEPVIEKEIPAPQAQMFPENSKVEHPAKPASPKPVAPAPVEEKKENISILSD